MDTNKVIEYEKKLNELSCAFCTELTNSMHLHAENELIICVKGSAILNDGKQSYRFNAGEGVFVTQYKVHFYENIDSSSIFAIICFSNSVIQGLKNRILLLNDDSPVFNYANYSPLAECLAELKEQFESHRSVPTTLLMGFLNILLYRIENKINLIHSEKTDLDLLTKIINYCNENYMKKISLEDLSKLFSYSTNYISHVFNDSMKISFPQYVNFLRLSAACSLLKNTNNTVTQIAGEVGFSSLRNFNKTFESVLKITPTEYKEKFSSKTVFNL